MMLFCTRQGACTRDSCTTACRGHLPLTGGSAASCAGRAPAVAGVRAEVDPEVAPATEVLVREAITLSRRLAPAARRGRAHRRLIRQRTHARAHHPLCR